MSGKHYATFARIIVLSRSFRNAIPNLPLGCVTKPFSVLELRLKCHYPPAFGWGPYEILDAIGARAGWVKSTAQKDTRPRPPPWL